MLNIKRILVPMDFTPESVLALDWAVVLAKSEGHAHLYLCHVLPIIAAMGPHATELDYEMASEREENEIKRKLKAFEVHIPKNVPYSFVVGRGNIASEVERLCGQMGIDLVVMTTHGRRGLSRLLHGSTTEETARLAPCPVLVLHQNTLTREAVGATCEKGGEGW